MTLPLLAPANSTSADSIELLAPAGNWDCAHAAIENGADAIYFGLDCGFNARHRAHNFGLNDLPQLAAMLRQRGVRGYATLNTLVFPAEMSRLVDVVEQIAQAGLDAVLVQDFGVAQLVRALCPQLEIHASTQMSLTSAETIGVARQLGLSRVVLARELSVKEIAQIASATDMPLEVFIHGALCVAYSGQCLTSESLGGRSANRGQCAQACRLPYELICDGEQRDLQDVQYLLSPQDLAGYAAIPALIDAGVASLKIEGRLKTAEYVANITGHYRAAIDEALRHRTVSVDEQARREMELSFSRGFSPGWLEGNDHKRLVPGRDSAKRGVELGTIREIDPSGHRIRVHTAAPLALGDGIAIRQPGNDRDQGGRIYSLHPKGSSPRAESQRDVAANQSVWIGLGRGEIDWSQVECGFAVFKNDDPQLNRRLKQSFSGKNPVRRRPIDVIVHAEVGQPLRLVAHLDLPQDGASLSVDVRGDQLLQPARKHPADEPLLREKLGRLGGTPFELRHLDARLRGEPMVPMGLLNQLRREVVDQLLQRLADPPPRTMHREAAQALLHPIGSAETAQEDAREATRGNAKLHVMCRSLAQVELACGAGADQVYADFHDIRQYREAIALARHHGVPIGLASVRMQKPGERGLLRVLARHQPDVLLVRNLAALDFAKRHGIAAVADFSLNVANHRSAQWVRSLGADRVTASYDLNRDQLLQLLDSMPACWVEVVIHQHVPMFHMEHCVFCSVLSPGTDKTNCGRPCDDHLVQLRDRVGAEHPLVADVACRNTLYNATPQSGAEIVPELIRRGVNVFRVELLDEDERDAGETIRIYRELLSGNTTGREVWRQLKADNRLGVTRGTLETERNPLAIL